MPEPKWVECPSGVCIDRRRTPGVPDEVTAVAEEMLTEGRMCADVCVVDGVKWLLVAVRYEDRLEVEVGTVAGVVRQGPKSAR